MGTEDLIRDALRARAEQTPPPGHVLAALRRPRKSRKPLFLAVTAATAAAAVAVVATTVGRPSAEAPPAASTTLPTAPATTTTTTATPSDPFTLAYSPSWLPDGLVERHRFVDEAGSTQRVWQHGSGQMHSPSFELLVPKDAQAQDALRRQIASGSAADKVTINGTTALVVDPTKSTTPTTDEDRGPDVPDGTPPDAKVILNPAPDRYLELVLSNAAEARADAIRIAESLRPDSTPLRGPVSIGGAVAHQARVTGQGWQVSTTGEVNGITYGANLGSYVEETGSTSVAPVAVTARGASAEYLGARGGYLRVDLGPNLHLLVFGRSSTTASAQELIAVAEAVTVDTAPAWLTG